MSSRFGYFSPYFTAPSIYFTQQIIIHRFQVIRDQQNQTSRFSDNELLLYSLTILLFSASLISLVETPHSQSRSGSVPCLPRLSHTEPTFKVLLPLPTHYIISVGREVTVYSTASFCHTLHHLCRKRNNRLQYCFNFPHTTSSLSEEK